MIKATKDYQKQFPSLFEGLGNLGELFEIHLKEGAVPHCIYTPRQVPLPLREKVKQELDKMESMGVIEKSNDPTPWCAGMVVVPKRDGKIRICVDLKPLNESVLRKIHLLPIVDVTLAQLSGAKLFSKLDSNSGFWQIPLARQSPTTNFEIWLRLARFVYTISHMPGKLLYTADTLFIQAKKMMQSSSRILNPLWKSRYSIYH